MRNHIWNVAVAEPEKRQRQINRLSIELAERDWTLPPILLELLVSRHLDSYEQAHRFIFPDEYSYLDPLSIFGIDLHRAVSIVARAIDSESKIRICGDYDADGMTGTALLVRALRSLYANVDYAIPDRLSEGYGLNTSMVQEAASDRVSLLITVDNGIDSTPALMVAKERGLSTIVLDHHQPVRGLPPADCIVNPIFLAEDSPYRPLSGVGVAYALAYELIRTRATAGFVELVKPLQQLLAIGTMADMVPLEQINRVWVRQGLSLLPNSTVVGIVALSESAGLDIRQSRPEEVVTKLSPRINAVGRVGDPRTVIELLTTDDPELARSLAAKCEGDNMARQHLSNQAEEEAIAVAEDAYQYALDRQTKAILFLARPQWHPGVTGIVAIRLAQKFLVPTFVGSLDEQTGLIRGSARTVGDSFDLVDVLTRCKDLLVRFGGHKSAAGFTLELGNATQFSERLQAIAQEHALSRITIQPDVEVQDLSQLTLELFEQINQLQPFGIGNPVPTFWTRNLQVVEQRLIGRGQSHLKLRLRQDDGTQISAIGWGWARYYPLAGRQDVAYQLLENNWNGQRYLELQLISVRDSLGGGNGQTTRNSETEEDF